MSDSVGEIARGGGAELECHLEQCRLNERMRVGTGIG